LWVGVGMGVGVGVGMGMGVVVGTVVAVAVAVAVGFVPGPCVVVGGVEATALLAGGAGASFVEDAGGGGVVAGAIGVEDCTMYTVFAACGSFVPDCGSLFFCRTKNIAAAPAATASAATPTMSGTFDDRWREVAYVPPQLA
jgi:hypothetical protein